MANRKPKRRGKEGTESPPVRRGGTTERPPDEGGPETTPIPPGPGPGPGGPVVPAPGGPLVPGPGNPPPAPAPAPPPEPIDDYVKDEDRGVFIRWRPGRPARGGSHTQIHNGEGYSFTITIFWNARGEIETFVIVNLNPGGPDISIRKQAGEKIEYVVKRGNVIVVKTNKRIITYDGKRHAQKEVRV